MKTFFLLLFCLWISLFPNQLIAYSSIPEYNSDSSTSRYSSIGSYSNIENENFEKANNLNNAPSSNYENDAVAIDGQLTLSSNYQPQSDKSLDDEKKSGNEKLMSTGQASFVGQLKIDDDGAGYTHLDPTHSDQTWWQPNGKSLNADVDSYVVVPGAIAWWQGIRRGDAADVNVQFIYTMTDGNSYTYNKTINSRVGDLGPDSKGVGEISVAAVKQLGFGISDLIGVGPVPTFLGVRLGATPNTVDPMVTVTYYPSGTPGR